MEGGQAKRKTILAGPKLHKGQTEHYGFILRLINLIMSLCARRQQQQQQQRKVTKNDYDFAANVVVNCDCDVGTATTKRHANQ